MIMKRISMRIHQGGVFRRNWVNKSVISQCISRNLWSSVKQAPPDPILGLAQDFNADTDPRKVNLSIGAYRTDEGKPFVLDVVRKAEQIIVDENIEMEYLPILGSASFLSKVLPIPFGKDSPIINENRVVACQTLSGTGALRVLSEFLAKYWTHTNEIYVSDPTYPNHGPILASAGLTTAKYRYYEPKSCSLAFEGMIEDLKKIPENGMILLQTAGHNPTGVDPTQDQWREMAEALKGRNIMCVFDTAYQGFATGDFERDAFPIQHFVSEGINVSVCYSFAKNLGLYGHRGGFMAMQTTGAEEKARVESQLKRVVRAMYSNPPLMPAKIIETVVDSEELRNQWHDEVKMMSNRLTGMRTQLRDSLKAQGSTHDWDFFTKQIGMFAYSGLSPDQVDKLKKEWHIYMSTSGRISMCGLTTSNVNYVAEGIHAVTQ
eukprot:204587_1